MGPGFDVHSIALRSPEIEVEFALAAPGSRTIRVMGEYAQEATTDLRLHASAKALTALQERYGKPEGYALTINVNIPPRRGLGLSGAEAVGAVLCANFAFNLHLSRQAIVHIAATAEPSHHMDNVAAAALGGFNIVTRIPTNEYAEITTLNPPRDLGVAVLVPDIEKNSTKATREFLPDAIPRQKYVESLGYVSRISAAFASGDVESILETLPWDPVIEPTRAMAGVYGSGIDAGLLKEEKKMLIDKYHVAETMSGAGPSHALWYNISEDRKARKKDRIGLITPAIDLVSSRLESCGYMVREVFLTKPSARGAEIIRSNR